MGIAADKRHGDLVSVIELFELGSSWFSRNAMRHEITFGSRAVFLEHITTVRQNNLGPGFMLILTRDNLLSFLMILCSFKFLYCCSMKRTEHWPTALF